MPSTHGHPRFPNGTDSAALTETFSYTNGMLSSVALSGRKIDSSSITAATITPLYTPAGTLKKYTVAQTGGATQATTITQDSTLLPRPSSISTTLGGFATGTYTYDGAGNVLSMGSDNFKYDNRSRLISAYYNSGSTCTDSAGNTGRNQCFAYDRWANLTGVTGTNPRTLTTSTTTNRLSSGSYDNRGNLLTFGGQTLTWDDLSRQRKDLTASVTWQYLYRGDPERLVRIPWWGTSGPNVTRREAARYFTQGEGWTPSTGCTETGRSFTDVHCGDQDWQPIETFFDQGITAGCGSGNFCPDTAITRGQMMVFLLKVEHGSSYSPPACTGVFADVPCPSGARRSRRSTSPACNATSDPSLHAVQADPAQRHRLSLREEPHLASVRQWKLRHQREPVDLPAGVGADRAGRDDDPGRAGDALARPFERGPLHLASPRVRPVVAEVAKRPEVDRDETLVRRDVPAQVVGDLVPFGPAVVVVGRESARVEDEHEADGGESRNPEKVPGARLRDRETGQEDGREPRRQEIADCRVVGPHLQDGDDKRSTEDEPGAGEECQTRAPPPGPGRWRPVPRRPRSRSRAVRRASRRAEDLQPVREPREIQPLGTHGPRLSGAPEDDRQPGRIETAKPASAIGSVSTNAGGSFSGTVR